MRRRFSKLQFRAYVRSDVDVSDIGIAKRSWEVGDGESMKMNLRHNKRWMRFRGVSGRLQTDEDDEEDDEDKNFPDELLGAN